MSTNVKIVNDENCYYLIQDISGLDTYDRAKAIVNFCDKETKKFEETIDRAIMDIFERNGINIPNTNKSVLNRAFERLKSKGKNISVVDIYKNTKENEDYFKIIETKNHFSVMLETTWISGCKIEILQCGVEVKEIKL